MNTIQLLVLAVVQGLTEFLPVSSSGHLVLAERLLGLSSPGPALELVMHVGTLAAVCAFYRRRLLFLAGSFFRGRREGLLYAAWVLVSMVPAGLLYAACGDKISPLYDSPRAVGALLCANGVLLLLSRLADRRAGPGRPLGFFRALAMGAGQALAVLPGISRSGTSIFAGRLAGLRPAEAAEFSFVMSIPAIAGGTLLECLHSGVPAADAGAAARAALPAAVVVSAVVGYVALRTVVRVLERGAFWTFGPWCLAAGAAALAFC